MEKYVFELFDSKDEVEPGSFNPVKTPSHPPVQPSVSSSCEPASELTQTSGRRLVGVLNTEFQLYCNYIVFLRVKTSPTE